MYDPLGFISPLTIPARILIQDIWKLKLDWDDALPQDLIEKWIDISKTIENTTISFGRPYLAKGKALELHVFVDASQSAYGAVAYLSDGVSSTFVFSKSRVTPLRTDKKMLTIPQAELMAAVIGTRVASSILSAFQPLGISLSIFLWSDSQIVLYWIMKMGKIKCQFVHNRVDTIRNFNENHNVYWNYCPTASNPADLLSRGATHRHFQSSTTWLTGPAWLLKRSDWPAWEGNGESAAIFHLSVLSSVSTSAPLPSSTKGIDKVLDISRYKFSSLVRVTAIILRFINNVKLKGEITLRLARRPH